MRVVVINGYPRSGKDTFVDIAETKYKVKRHSTVDKVKRLATSMGWFGTKDEETRQMLSELKEFYIQWFDGVFKDVQREVLHAEMYKKDFLFIFSREPEEIQRIKEYCDWRVSSFHSILIRRNVSEKHHTSHSDKNVENFDYDYIMDNDSSMDDFKDNVIKILPLL